MSVEEDNSKVKRAKTSWVWQYFNEETKEEHKGEEIVKSLVMVCQIKEDPLLNICGVEYARKDSSTGNAIAHLRSRHNITQSGKVNIYTNLIYYNNVLYYYYFSIILTFILIINLVIC